MVALATIYLIVAPFYADPLPSLYCLLFIAAGIPVYFVFVYYKLSPKWLNRGLGKKLNNLIIALIIAFNFFKLVFSISKFRKRREEGEGGGISFVLFVLVVPLFSFCNHNYIPSSLGCCYALAASN